MDISELCKYHNTSIEYKTSNFEAIYDTGPI